MKNFEERYSGDYESLYTGYFKKFFNYGRKFTEDNSLIEDSIQEVFLDIWNKQNTHIVIDSPTAYYFAAFRYTLFKNIKLQRRMGGLGQRDDEPVFSIEQRIISGEISEERRQKVQLALTILTSRQREVIFLRFFEGMSYEQIAGVLGITTKATYKIMYRSLSRLKEVLIIPIFIMFFFLD